jgi:hypothetical protein
MKRKLIVTVIFAATLLLLLLLWPQRRSITEATDMSHPPPAETNSSDHSDSFTSPERQQRREMESAAQINAERDYVAKRDETVRRSNEAGNPPVWFYGLVVDQDTNPLPNVSVEAAVIEEYVDPFPETKTKTTRLQRQTGADGRFEINGLKGKYVAVYTLTKEGYEQEYPGQVCGMFGAVVTGFDKPQILRLWSTNLHEPLIGAEKSFVIIPDGRRYAIDLVKGTIAEGDAGDFVAWIKRPESVTPGQRYDWSCEVTVPNGGLLESATRAMFIAPEVGYTNAFACQEHANPNRWSGATGDKRFYVRLRDGQMYARITINLYADYHGKQPAMIHLSYAVNPSGSRLLR